MDPKTLNNLDPKLRATYERIMNTPTNPSATPPYDPNTPAPASPVTTPQETARPPISTDAPEIPPLEPPITPVVEPTQAAEPILSSSPTQETNNPPIQTSDPIQPPEDTLTSSPFPVETPSTDTTPNSGIENTDQPSPASYESASPDSSQPPAESASPESMNPSDQNNFSFASSDPLPVPSVAPEKGLAVSSKTRMLYIIGATIFLIAYAVFWLKIFKFI